jgi:type I restriction enzyme S subunit
MMRVSVKPEIANIEYVYYYFCQPEVRQYIVSTAGGGAQPIFNLTTLKNFELELPSLLIQNKIANILSTYDRLIENNTRRIKILEEMARSLYDEWFVKFHFPGREQPQMVDSELGAIPEEWQVKTLGNVCNIVMGQSPKSEFYNEIGEGLPFHQGVTNFGARFPTDKTYCSVLNRIAEAGDILFSVCAPVGRINIATKKIIIGRGLCAIRSKLENQAFLFQQLKEKFQEEDSIGGGTIFKSVTKEDMHGIKIIAPPSLLMDKFEGIIQPVFQSIEVLTTKNANLRPTRDLLLPKLISGEIDVENLDIETGVINESEVVSDSSQEAIAG